MKKYFFSCLVLVLLVLLVLVLPTFKKEKPVPLWSVRSIDTVKYSRDLAKEKRTSQNFTEEIDRQVKDIALTGANFIAVGTPYDEEFIPFLNLWVESARKNNLNVWFRGNFSGWEGWFGYKNISKEEHKIKLAQFIEKNASLFEDGDIFTSCPECENGSMGDPRETGNIQEFRDFLIEEYQISAIKFGEIGKKVTPGYYSMNYDVAKLIMDKETTQRLGGVVVIDHYVVDPLQIKSDIQEISSLSGGIVVLGEFGVPIPDIHGKISDQQQADWIDQSLSAVLKEENLLGLNYWVNKGGSSNLWNNDGTPKLAVQILSKYFNQKKLMNP